jgi:hypothetical protein
MFASWRRSIGLVLAEWNLYAQRIQGVVQPYGLADFLCLGKIILEGVFKPNRVRLLSLRACVGRAKENGKDQNRTADAHGDTLLG